MSKECERAGRKVPLLAQMGGPSVPCIPIPKKIVRRRLFGRSDRMASSILHVNVPIPTFSAAVPSAPPAPIPLAIPPIPIPLVAAGVPADAAPPVVPPAAASASSTDSGIATDNMSVMSNASSSMSSRPSSLNGWLNRGFDTID